MLDIFDLCHWDCHNVYPGADLAIICARYFGSRTRTAEHVGRLALMHVYIM